VPPGCLTGESEERETWTAESLRVVCHRVAALWFAIIWEAIPVPCGWTRLRRYTFQVNTNVVKAVAMGAMQIARMSMRARTRWDLVKRCDQPEQVLSNLRV
jgi:hypothetical protein